MDLPHRHHRVQRALDRQLAIQSTGADILRLACVWGHRRGIKICAPIHDAVLIESSI
jgi:hypothetical protein